MGRSPCCAKMGLKKGPWSPEEDAILVNYIRLHGHSNWRALPKQAGLLRCGKSCRLRWTNYLRPDIKRGNFTPDEEDTIIKLHEMLGNRWSAIAAKLPGRTDNEIKNVWHTHLKKRLPKQDELQIGPTASDNSPIVPDGMVGPTKISARKSKSTKKTGVLSEEPERKHVKGMKNKNNSNSTNKNNDNNNDNNDNNDDNNARRSMSSTGDPISPQPCTSELSTITSTSTSENDQCCKDNVREVKKEGYIDDFLEFSDDFWMQVLSVEDTAMSAKEFPYISQCCTDTSPVYTSESNIHCDDMDFFWHNLLTRSDDLTEISNML